MRELQASEAPASSKLSDGDAALKEMWEAAAKAFEKICGESLARGEIKSFDDLQKKIENSNNLNKASYGLEPDAEDGWDQAKSLGLKSLKYVKMLVGAVSQVSSFTPIPAAAANVSSAALGFVFDIPKAIKGYNDAIDQVFSETSSALSQFQIYWSMEKIDPALTKQIHLVLISFVKLCAHVVKYRQGGRRARLLRQVKSIFDDDSGLADEMTEFKRVLQQQRDVEGTLTLAAVLDTNRDVELLLERFIVFGKAAEDTQQAVQQTQKGVQALKDDADRIKTLGKIRDTLGVPSTVRLDAKTTQTCTNIVNQCLPGTGDWIWTHEAFSTWTASVKEASSTSSSSPHMLLVTGPPSSGKTSASALITRHLEDRKEEDRIYVAHYFFPASTQKSGNAASVPVAAALRYMAFQIARVDATVRNALSKACDAEGASAALRRLDDKLDALWKELKIGAPKSGPLYYLIFDGIEYLPEDQAEKLLRFVSSTTLTGDPAGRVRVVISGTTDRFETSKVALGAALRIRMEENNEPDMRVIIKNALAERDMLQNARAGSEQQRAHDKIVEKLPKNVQGSYYLLQLGLVDVMRLLSTRSAALALDRFLDQSMSSHEAAIKALQRSLTTDEIRELNELLKWVLFSNEPLTLDQLEAVMFLFSDTESLASLQYIIKHKYAAVLKVTDSFVFGQDGVKDYLEKGRDAADRSFSSEHSTISMTININNVSQELCANFLWDLAHKSIRDKFKFDFDGDASSGLISGGGRGAIKVDEFDAHHTIVQRAFQYLDKPPQEQTAAIGKYLVCWLPYHLGRLRDLQDEDKGTLMPNENLEIGRNLYMLFQNDEVLQRHKNSFMQTYWIMSEMKDLRKWVTDSAVTRKLDKRWRDNVQQATSPVKGFLKELATMIVKGFIRERSWDVNNSSYWLEEFMKADAESKLPQGDTSSEASLFVGSSDMIGWERVSEWCQDFLSLPDTDLDSLWYERLAALSTDGRHWVEPQVIVSLWQRAVEKPDPSWLCYRGSGLAYSRQNQMVEATAQMKLALKEAMQEGASPTPEAEAIIDLNLDLGRFTFAAGDVEGAAGYYLAACKSEDVEKVQRAHLGYLEARLEFPNAEETRQLLRDAFAAEDGMERMAGVFKTVAPDLRHDTFISKLFTVAKSDSDLMQAIVRAMEAATPAPDDQSRAVESSDRFAEDEIRGVLLYDRGVAAYTYGAIAPSKGANTDSEPIAEALRLWHACRSQLANVGGHNAFVAQYEAAAAIVGHYFRSELNGIHLDHHRVELEKIASDLDTDMSSPGCDAVGFLGVLHMRNGEADKARAVLGPRFRNALQVLSDDLPDNDRVGFSTLHKTLEHYQDFKNAGVALMLLGQPDMVADALRVEWLDVANQVQELAMKYVTIEAEAEGTDDPGAPYRSWVAARQERLLDAFTTLAAETVRVAHSAVPDVVQQSERVAAAQAHATTALEAAAAVVLRARQVQTTSESEEGNSIEVQEGDVRTSWTSKDDDEILVVATGLLQSRLNQEWSVSYWWSCDGRTANGVRCTNMSDFEHAFYHCLYCSNRDFCEECLLRLRDPGAEVKITVCDAKHKWLRLPPQGEEMYVGPKATSVRVPEGMRPVGGDERIVEIWHDKEKGDNVVSVEAWKEGLAREWGLKIEELQGVSA